MVSPQSLICKARNRYMSVEEQEKFPRGLEGQGQRSTEGQRISVTVGRQVMAGVQGQSRCRYQQQPVPMSY